MLHNLYLIRAHLVRNGRRYAVTILLTASDYERAQQTVENEHSCVVDSVEFVCVSHSSVNVKI